MSDDLCLHVNDTTRITYDGGQFIIQRLSTPKKKGAVPTWGGALYYSTLAGPLRWVRDDYLKAHGGTTIDTLLAAIEEADRLIVRLAGDCAVRLQQTVTESSQSTASMRPSGRTIDDRQVAARVVATTSNKSKKRPVDASETERGR